jgi:hypothetical protein
MGVILKYPLGALENDQVTLMICQISCQNWTKMKQSLSSL